MTKVKPPPTEEADDMDLDLLEERDENDLNMMAESDDDDEDDDEDLDELLKRDEQNGRGSGASPSPSPAPASASGAPAGPGRPGGRGGRAAAREKAAQNRRAQQNEKETSEEEDEDDDEEEEEEEEEEDSSDMDVQECEKKRTELSDDLGDLEKQFAILREQLYRERIAQIEAKLQEVKTGKAPEYLQPLDELQLNMKNRLEVGTVLLEMRRTNIKNKFDAECLATDQNLESEKDLLYDTLKADLEEKIHILEEDKHNVDFSSGLWELHSGHSRRRKADPMDPDRRKKPVTVNGPYIVYMLSDEVILDDWQTIKKSLAQRKKLKA